MIPRRGFTLIEVLVVITIIIIITASAVPAFRFITGSRSIESSQNIIAAMVGRARSQALADGDHRGVFFFLDPITDRTTMALVQQASVGDLGQYHGWARDGYAANQVVDKPAVVVNAPLLYYSPGSNNTQSTVISLNNNYADLNSKYLGTSRYAVLPFGCIYNNTPAYTGNRAGTAAGNTYWGPLGISIDMVADTDFQLLPQGVGAQLLNSNPANQPNFDRYLRIGCIMFDKNGRFESIPWSVNTNSTLGSALYLADNLDLTIGNIQPLYSQFGIVLYDRQTFLAQTIGGNNFGEGNWIFSPSSPPNKIFFRLPPKFPASFNDEMGQNAAGQPPSKEQWLDNNSLPLLIDRYNGTIIKGE